jgi:transcriptional regulator with XRE-family HTH domain
MSPVQLGVELRARRLKAGLTQAELASALGATQPAIARAEAGRVVPSFLFVDQWAAATGLPLTLGRTTEALTPAQKRRLVRRVVGEDVFDPWERLEAKRARGLDVEPEQRYLNEASTSRARRKSRAVRRG